MAWTDETSKQYWGTAFGNLKKGLRNSLFGEQNQMDAYPTADSATSLGQPQRQGAALSAPVIPLQGTPSIAGGAVQYLNRDRVPGFQVAPANTEKVNPVTNIGGGISLQHDREGNRTYTMGTQGQDGYGRMTVRSGSALPTLAAPARPSGASGMSITGPADAVERFNRPVGGPPTEVPTGQMIDPISPDYSFLKSGEQSGVPKYLGPESGLGWKTRLAMYKEDMDNYRQQMGTQAALNLEGMREAGAGQRALLTAKGINDRNAIEQQQVDQQASQFQAGAALRDAELQGKQIALGDVKTMQALKDTMMRTDPSSPEYQAAYLRWAALNGRNENNYGVLDQYDENGQKVGAALYNRASGEVVVNPKGAALQKDTPLPADKGKRVVGAVYMSPDGKKAVWDGTGLVPTI